MSGLGSSNTLGNPNPGNYFLGRGQLFLSILDAVSNLPLKWRNMGNAPMLKLAVKTAKVQHYNSQSALKRADDEVATQQDMTLSLTLDELSAENVAAFVSGDTANSSLAAGINPANPAIAGFTNATTVLNANATAGDWYDIQTTTGVRAWDILDAKAAIAVTAPGTPATLVSGTDYILDLAMGRFQLTAAGLVKVNTGGAGIISVVMTADASASNIQRTRGETQSPVRVAVKFIPLNAKSPKDRQEIQFHSVMLVGNGDLSLIEDKYTEMSYDGLCGANVQVDANSPYFTITKLDVPRN